MWISIFCIFVIVVHISHPLSFSGRTRSQKAKDTFHDRSDRGGKDQKDEKVKEEGKDIGKVNNGSGRP